MRLKFLLSLGLILSLVLTGLAGCTPTGSTELPAPQELRINLGSQQEGISVTGEGKVAVVPDIANISLGVEAQSTTVMDAQSQAATAMANIMSSLIKSGIASRDIRTQSFSITKVTRWDDKNQKEILIGYRVTNSVAAKIRDVPKAGATIDAAVAAGGDLTFINNISFTVDNPVPYQKEARDKASADAKNKAEQLAASAGVKLDKPTYISESSYFPPPIPIFKDAISAPATQPTTAISPGEMEITVNVQTVYGIIK